jgi:hypothetical protein
MRRQFIWFIRVMVISILMGGYYNEAIAQKKNMLSFSFNPMAGSGVWYNFLPLFPTFSKDVKTPKFSFGFTCEYQRSFNPAIQLGIGIEYRDVRFGARRISYEQNSSGQKVETGKTDFSFDYHYFSAPITFYYSFIHSTKINFYSYLGLSPGIVMDITKSELFTDSNGVVLLNETQSIIHPDSVSAPLPNKFSLELKLGLGVRYFITPKWNVFVNTLLGFNCIPSYENGGFVDATLLAGYVKEHTLRYGVDIGVGYSF